MKYFGKYIVMDIEFTNPHNKTNEIIALSAKKIYTTEFGGELKEGETFKKYIKPQYKIQEQKKLLDLTHIDKKELEAADDFYHVFKEFLKWCNDGLDTLYIVWGNRDEYVLYKECKSHGLIKEYNNMDFVDLQSYIIEKDDIPFLPSLVSICEKEFGKFDGEPHNVEDDTLNTAKLVEKIITKN